MTLQQRVAALIVARGVVQAARQLGLSRETTLRLATPGCRVQKGSEALAASRLDTPPPEGSEGIG